MPTSIRTRQLQQQTLQTAGNHRQPWSEAEIAIVLGATWRELPLAAELTGRTLYATQSAQRYYTKRAAMTVLRTRSAAIVPGSIRTKWEQGWTGLEGDGFPE